MTLFQNMKDRRKMNSTLYQCPLCERIVRRNEMNNGIRFFCKNCKVWLEPISYGFQWPKKIFSKMTHNKSMEELLTKEEE